MSTTSTFITVPEIQEVLTVSESKACNGADPTTVGMCVCISLATGLILSIIIGRFEFACKGEAFKKDSGLAVAPGMAVVMIVLLIKFLIGTVIV